MENQVKAGRVGARAPIAARTQERLPLVLAPSVSLTQAAWSEQHPPPALAPPTAPMLHAAARTHAGAPAPGPLRIPGAGLRGEGGAPRERQGPDRGLLPLGLQGRRSASAA